MDLDNGGGIPEITRFQEHFHEYKIALYEGLNRDSIILEGQVEFTKRIHLLLDDVIRHYHVMTNLTDAMEKQQVCKSYNKGCRRDVTHV